MNFTTILILRNVHLQGKPKSIQLDAESLKLHHSYSVAHMGACMSFLPEQRKYYEKLTHPFYFIS